MELHARIMCGESGDRDVLNVGFGLGLIDTAIQAAGPRYALRRELREKI